VIALCTQILRDPDEAQDVAQEAFVQAYRSLAGYRGDGTFGAWIGRIASRLAIARATVAKKRATWPNAAVEMEASQEHANPERRLVDLEDAQALRRAVDDLPADQREVVSLRFYEDMPLDRIAARTGAPIGTVKSRLHRGLARLRHQGNLRSAQ
jgi:RNA polymerase sigma-70 factor, ECF subfamily